MNDQEIQELYLELKELYERILAPLNELDRIMVRLESQLPDIQEERSGIQDEGNEPPITSR